MFALIRQVAVCQSSLRLIIYIFLNDVYSRRKLIIIILNERLHREMSNMRNANARLNIFV